MGKVSNAIHLLEILMDGRKYELQELADLLEVTPRMIRSYKEDLEQCGIDIETIRGRYGGYYLKKDKYLPVIHFNDKDFAFLKQIKSQLKREEKQQLSILMDKMIGIRFQKSLFHFESDTVHEYYNLLMRAIKKRQKVYIEYVFNERFNKTNYSSISN